jgi:hypothetical protein
MTSNRGIPLARLHVFGSASFLQEEPPGGIEYQYMCDPVQQFGIPVYLLSRGLPDDTVIGIYDIE